MKEKIKIYKLGISKTFPKTHSRAFGETWFKDNILRNFWAEDSKDCKKHTIRAGENWRRKIYEVKTGKAILVLFSWEEKPYNSPQENWLVFAMPEVQVPEKYTDIPFVSATEIETQALEFFREDFNFPRISEDKTIAVMPRLIAANDGLSFSDFKEWFRDYDLSKPMTIIHFTKFRY